MKNKNKPRDVFKITLDRFNGSGYYSLISSLFIIYLSSLVFSYLIYSFISYSFRMIDFVGENIAIENPYLLVFIAMVLFIIFVVVLYFDIKKISVLILHLFSFFSISFLFIFVNKNKWLEYENTFYIISAVILLCVYFAWFVSKINLQKITDFFSKYAVVFFVFVAASYLLYFSIIAIERHQRFYSQLYDLGWEHQVLHNLATTGVPYSTIESEKGIINWADHTSFIYYLLVPFYKLFPTVEFMLIVQVIAVVLSAMFIYLLCVNSLKNRLFSLVISVVFLFHPSVQGVLLYDFHPSVLALPLFFLLFFLAQKKNFTGVLIATVLLCMVREDFIFFAFFVPLFLLLLNKIDLKKTVVLTAIVIIISAISYVIMKLCGGGIADYDKFYFLDNKFTGVLAALFVNPFFVFSKLFDADKLDFILITSAPLLFVFLLNKKAWILLVPAFLFTIFSKHLPHYLVGYHYSVMLVCAAFIGFIYYFERKEKPPVHLLPMMIVCIFFMNYFYGNFFSKSLRLVFVDPDIAVEKPDYIHKKWQGYYKNLRGQKDRDITEAINNFHNNLKIAADPFIAPHLSGRRYLYHINNYERADIIIDRKDNSATYNDFELIKETNLWKVYKKNLRREK